MLCGILSGTDYHGIPHHTFKFYSNEITIFFHPSLEFWEFGSSGQCPYNQNPSLNDQVSPYTFEWKQMWSLPVMIQLSLKPTKQQSAKFKTLKFCPGYIILRIPRLEGKQHRFRSFGSWAFLSGSRLIANSGLHGAVHFKMDGGLAFLRPFQQYFSQIWMMRGW